MHVKVLRNNGMRWTESGSVYVKGCFHHGGIFYSGETAIEYFSGVSLREEFERRVAQINGSFAVIIHLNGQVFAAVDRLRSIPLFLTEESGVIISDSASYVLKHMSRPEANDLSRSEFLLAGYSVGDSTLINGLKQLQAGQLLHYSNNFTETKFYYRHDHGMYWNKTKSEYYEDLDGISNRVFERLIESCTGKTIVVPLSGGYDSRFIAAGLRRRGVSNVTCFTYGRKESFEVKISRKVAAALGYDWQFVEYSKSRWHDCFSDSHFMEYASNLASLPNVQDYVAIKQLRDSKSVPCNSVFVPGYCGDLLGGSYVPYEFRINRTEKLKKEGLLGYFLRKHFGVDNVSDIDSGIIRRMEGEISSSHGEGWAEEFISANEEFFTRHKVAKHVVNALRSIEFFGYEWRMPLWDNELAEYFYRVPMSRRLEDGLYETFLLQQVFREFGVDYKKPAENRLKRDFKKYCPEFLLGASEFVYRLGVGVVRDEKKADFNAMTYFMQKCADELGVRKFTPKDNVIDIHARWYVDIYLRRVLS